MANHIHLIHSDTIIHKDTDPLPLPPLRGVRGGFYVFFSRVGGVGGVGNVTRCLQGSDLQHVLKSLSQRFVFIEAFALYGRVFLFPEEKTLVERVNIQAA